MSDYKAVQSSLEISRWIFDCLEDIDPIQYNGRNRPRMIRNINDCLQGRNDMPLEELMEWAAASKGGEYAARVQTSARESKAFKNKRPYWTRHTPRPAGSSTNIK